MYKYETHLHTSGVSACSQASVGEQMEFYKQLGYDGIFITNHFIDGNALCTTPDYRKNIEFFFSDYEEAKSLENKIGIKVFCGVEMTENGTDFLVFGLDKKWFLDHPEIEGMRKREQLPFLRLHGAFVVHAHPFREARWIECIRLFPGSVDGVEVINANRDDFVNGMAKYYAESYGLLKFAGSDNHAGKKQKKLAGMMSAVPVENEAHFIALCRQGKLDIFSTSI